MFNFLKKKNTVDAFHSVANGTLIPMSSVEDQVFSAKMLGDGFAVRPTDNNVFAPVAGTVTSVFPTQHAISITTDSGLEVLVHMGLETVALDGVPFNVLVSEGQVVTPETQLATMDLEELKKTETLSTIVVAITNMDKVASMTDATEQAIAASAPVLEVTPTK
ncbi:PTS glucose transporter subunit IIA [Vagococcus coleopterorum]|uniref:PTS glucose transporter subunit IIA n=1 Tax=Vagococcus coleopterorum TaxID=2714946 RepID=A0A6G8APC3_9ENTE|nr:PTS glucose transporter subunit IIA [Vagococcus coleopterorum]QIL46792.1 PTS glucose transporter subunit IIA [Vagococcus coleopterorum]